ncbi:peptidoglycan-binding domain-containing protein [Colletotrichum plurivorum]|uniref:Peptidoglycan-binding domain-containing protein n=1 Tax=Colletotrichum plurivorum TaxID=2175906 RepID=A0A8H6U595_9PEZI|nr:peptidoglycan-binding domain-containing protein [Colletotrichum plurivorum]
MASSEINPHDFWLSFGPSLKSGSKTAKVPDITPGEYTSPHPKRIIVCCDGTWQTSTTISRNIPSNVTRLSRAISKFGDNGKPQIVYYGSGVGTGDGVTLGERIRQALFSDGLVADVIKAYNFIVTNYTLGDEIFCFGFSRGAYTARSVAGLINDIGIVLPSEMHDFHELYKIYREHQHNQSAMFRESVGYQQWITGVFDEEKEHWVRLPHRLPPDCTRLVKVVGVFDTVGALGVPGHSWAQVAINAFSDLYGSGIDNHSFHNHSLSRYIEHAFHALALDEGGYSFSPTLWRLPDTVNYDGVERNTIRLQNDFRISLESHAPPETLSSHWREMIRSDEARSEAAVVNLQQVWFPGSHINVGGGNLGILAGLPFDYEQLSLISLAWMCDQIREHLALEDSQANTLSTLAEREMMERRRYITVASYEREMMSTPVWFLSEAWRVVTHPWHPWARPVEDVAGIGWSTGLIVDAVETTFSWLPKAVATRQLIRTPQEYNKEDDFGNTGRGGDTCEAIHPSAAYRWIKDSTYRPSSLDKFVRTTVEVDGVVQYVWKKEITTEVKTPIKVLGHDAPLKFFGINTRLYTTTKVTTELELRETPIRLADKTTRALASYSEDGGAFVEGLAR